MGLNKLAAFSCMSLTLACASAAHADTFSTDQFVTYSQNDWGSGTVASYLLGLDYNAVYASTNDVLSVGVAGVQNQYLMSFVGSSNVLTFLPESGPPGPLTSNLIDPTSSPADDFGGDVVALDLNIAFSNANDLAHPTSVAFGDLVFANFTGDLSGLNGLTVSDFLTIADTCLSGGSCPDGGLDNIAQVTDELNISFESEGTPSAFADANLALPSSGTPTPTPEPSSLLLLACGLIGLGFVKRQRRLFRGPP